MKRKFIVFIVLLLVVLVLCFCDSNTNKHTAEENASIAGTNTSKVETPSEVLKSALWAANGGWYSKADKFIHTEALYRYQFFYSKENVVRIHQRVKKWDDLTEDGTIEKIEVLEEKIRGEKAVVQIRIFYKTASSDGKKIILIKENGNWRIINFF